MRDLLFHKAEGNVQEVESSYLCARAKAACNQGLLPDRTGHEIVLIGGL